MTDSPSPSDPSKSPGKLASWAFRRVLLALGAVALAAGGYALFHRGAPPSPAPKADPVANTPGLPAAGPPGAPGPAQSQAQVPARAPVPPPALPPATIVPPAVEPAPPFKAEELSGFRLKPPEPQTEPDPPASERYELTLRLERGDTVEKMLADIDVPEAERRQIAQKLQGLLGKKRLAIGEAIQLSMQTLPERPDAPRVLSLSVRPQPEREYIITRQDDASYDAEEKVYKVSPRVVRIEGERKGPLMQSGAKAGVPAAAMTEFVRALAFDIDFQREIKEGQRFTVLLEQRVTSDGHVTHPGRLLAGEWRLLKRTVTVIRFRPQGGAEGFFNRQGESVVRSFLRTPMDTSRVTSRFGMREHPILGFSAMHAGVDFAAASGTPILAAGNGKVVMAGPNGGYGNYVKLQHTHDVATAYAHMSRIGPGIKPGAMVRQGQVIGFVGSTGLSTGPHLHYEFLRGGKHVNPLTQKFAMRAMVAGKDAGRFQALARQYVNQMKHAPMAADLKPKPKPTTSAQIVKRDE